MKNRSWAQENRGETAKVQSPNGAAGVILESTKDTVMLLKIVLMVFNKSLNEDPRLFTIIHRILMMRVPFDRKPRPDGTKPRKEKMSGRLPSRQASSSHRCRVP